MGRCRWCGCEPDLHAHAHPPHRRGRVPCCLVHGPQARWSRGRTPAGPACEHHAARDDRRGRRPRRPPPRRRRTRPSPTWPCPPTSSRSCPRTSPARSRSARRSCSACSPTTRPNWRPMADDDRYVRNALKKTNRYDGEVFRKNISLSQLSAYGPLVNDLGVNQSPAVVVIDRNLKGTVLTGYVDRIAINQAIADARRDSIDPAITDEYLRRRTRSARASTCATRGSRCRRSAARRRATPPWTASSRSAGSTRRAVLLDAGAGEVEGPEGPVAADDRRRRRGRDAHGRVDQEREPARRPRRLHGLRPKGAAKLDRRFDDAGVTACVDNRRS